MHCIVSRRQITSRVAVHTAVSINYDISPHFQLLYFYFSYLSFSISQQTQSVLPAPKSADDQDIATAETQHQHQYDAHQQQDGHNIRPHPQQLISQHEYLAFLREQEAQEQEIAPAPQYEKDNSPQGIANSFYARNPGHPLAGSTLEKEIEKLVGATAQQYPLATAPHTSPRTVQGHLESAPTHTLQTAPQAHRPSPHSISQQHQQQQQPQLFRSPVVFKNPNDIVYIPYQQQVLRDQYPRPASGITKAKIAYISAYPPLRAPLPSEAIEYGRPNAQAQTQFVPSKQQESFKDLYIQQQRENQLKRLQNQQAHIQHPQHHQQQPQHHHQQLATNDNVEVQSPAKPLSIDLLPKKTLPPLQNSATTVADQSTNSNIAQFAERLFKTPLEEQKPLSQEQFKALVAAGYPVEAVPVPVAVTSSHKGPHSPLYYPQTLQRYSPATASLPYPKPFQPQPKSIAQPQAQYQQISHQHAPHRSLVPTNHHSQHAPAPSQPTSHRFYPQGQLYGQQQQQQPQSGAQYARAGPFTYVLRQGENEESAAEQLRQQIIQEINAQSQKGVITSGTQVVPQIAAGQTRVIYPPTSQLTSTSNSNGGQQGQIQSSAAEAASTTGEKPVEEAPRAYYKTLEYY